MEPTPIFTQEQYNTLVAAIALGATEVKYSDKTVVYRDLDEMLALASLMATQLGLNVSFGNSGRRIADFKNGR